MRGIAIATVDALPPTGVGLRWLIAGLASVSAIIGLAGYWAVLVIRRQ
jgi:hypothetical protein